MSPADGRDRPGSPRAGGGRASGEDRPGKERTGGGGDRRGSREGAGDGTDGRLFEDRVDGLAGVIQPPRRSDRERGPERPDDELLDETLEGLERGGFEEAEAYAKRGRSRRLSVELGHRATSFHDERGWAVRAGTARASLFACGSGALPPGGPSGQGWPEPDGRPIRLPDPDAAGTPAPWTEPSDFETPLIGETEGMRLLESLERALQEELRDELPGARLLSAHLEDGSSDSRLVSLRGVRGRRRLRVAVLRAEAMVASRRRRGDPVRAVIHLAAREARRFGPTAVARQLADRLAVAAAGTPDDFPGRDRGDLLLAPAVGARLLAALTPLLVGPGAAQHLEPLRDRRGRIASERLTIVDDGRFPGGVLEAPVDGEGVATRAVTLVDEGTFRQSLVSWRATHARTRGQARSQSGAFATSTPGGRPTGCARRASWRDVPETAPTHLYVAPVPTVAPTDLLADLARGYYLVDAAGAPRVDWERGTFRLPVLGFAVQGGRARGPVAGVELTGSLRTLLRGIQAVARDLSFFPLDGMVGAPTLRLTGLELRAIG